MAYLGRKGASAALTTADIPDNSITAAKIVDGAVGVADIGADAVGASELANNAVDTNAIADDAITGGKLANDIAINTSGAITTTGAFTSVGIDDNSNALAMTIDATENVGIGTTTPDLGGASYAAAQTVTTISGSTNDQPGGILELNSTAANAYNSIQGEIVFTGSNQTTGHKRKAVIRGIIDTSSGSTSNQYGGGIVFLNKPDASTTMTERMRIDSAGDTIIQGNLKIVTDKGINFYGGTDPDTSGTATGNILSDYEEGTFTPTLLAGGGSLGSLATQVGGYTKIGNRVFISIHISSPTKNSQTGAITVSGLPFAVGTQAVGGYTTFSVWNYSGITILGSLIVRTNLSAVDLQIQTATDAGAGSNLDQGDIASDMNLMIGGNYVV